MNNCINGGFEKISADQALKDFDTHLPEGLRDCTDYDEEGAHFNYTKYVGQIKYPRRATIGSAGYDFYAPCDIEIPYGESKIIPTGLRCKMEFPWVLMIFPRSGHGFKYGVELANTVGVIDSDYYYASNEGHIMIKLVNKDSTVQKPLKIEKGTAFCQGVFLPFGIVYDDKPVSEKRHGGMGSTDNKHKV